jgi:hypothetical protein
MSLDTVEFAARRRVLQEAAVDLLRPAVARWIENPDDPAALADLNELLARLYTDTYVADGGLRRARTAGYLNSLRGMFNHTTAESDPERVATWLAVATLNAATIQAGYDDPSPVVYKWTTMHDAKVRHAHAEADRQRRPPGSYFHVGGENLRYPGDPRGRLDNILNCRCILQSVPFYPDAASLSAATKEKPMPLDTPLAWHGVLAPENEWSGDGRRFSPGALRNRDLPLPLTWQKATSDGHDGSVVVGRIDSIERVDDMIRGEGTFIDTPETDEVVGLIAEFGRFGVSIDADDSEFEFDEDSQQVTFTSARIASASLVSIPAFASAFVAFGTWAEEMAGSPPFLPKKKAPDGEQDGEPDPEEECDPNSEDYEDCLARKDAQQKPVDKNDPRMDKLDPGASDEADVFISEDSWDGSAGRFTPEQWKASTILHVCDGEEKSCHKLPIKEPGGALSRAGVHAAASRFDSVDAPPEEKAKAARALRGAYKQLGEEPPEGLAASAFGRGPGWVTNPVETRRIWAYWTQPGHEGYAKINWGVPGDFNRCRVQVGEEIGESSPEDLRFLNQICAQWHHDATGFWPGRAPSEVGSLSKLRGKPARALSLVASAGFQAPAAWFRDPKLTEPTHLTVTPDGRVFGHIAEWKSCHIGYDGVCVAPPPSSSNYAYFATGSVLTDDGGSARTGVISLGGGHASGQVGPRMAAAHYDSTSAAVADVSVGEDEHGIWCAGWLRPGTDDHTATALRASDISGDWREIGGNMELIAALAVNVAGFPVAAVRDQRQLALVASGVVARDDNPLAGVVRAVVAAMARRDKMAELRQRVGG